MRETETCELLYDCAERKSTFGVNRRAKDISSKAADIAE